jgi:hypothetical protein
MTNLRRQRKELKPAANGVLPQQCLLRRKTFPYMLKKTTKLRRLEAKQLSKRAANDKTAMKAIDALLRVSKATESAEIDNADIAAIREAFKNADRTISRTLRWPILLELISASAGLKLIIKNLDVASSKQITDDAASESAAAEDAEDDVEVDDDIDIDEDDEDNDDDNMEDTDNADEKDDGADDNDDNAIDDAVNYNGADEDASDYKRPINDAADAKQPTKTTKRPATSAVDVSDQSAKRRNTTNTIEKPSPAAVGRPADPDRRTSALPATKTVGSPASSLDWLFSRPTQS